MKSVFAMIIGLLALTVGSSQAERLRIDNNASANADFSDLQLAHDRATAGDTLYIQGSGSSYGSLSISKQLVIIGPGYFLAKNDSTQANPASARIDGLTCTLGSMNSIVMGLDIRGTVDIAENNISLRRNLISNTSRLIGVLIRKGIRNVLISQCFMQSGAAAGILRLEAGVADVLIENCFIENELLAQPSIIADASSSAVIRHNVLSGALSVSGSIVEMNILRDGPFAGTGNTITHNLCNASQFAGPAENNNRTDVDMAGVFMGSGSPDGQWRLQKGSPAQGAAADGGDAGMFGGSNTYVLSGQPPVPSIFFINGPASATAASGLQMIIKVKVNN